MTPKCQTQQCISLKTRDHCPVCFIFLIYGPLSTSKKYINSSFQLLFTMCVYIYIYTHIYMYILGVRLINP